MRVFTEHTAASLAEYISETERIYNFWGDTENMPDPWFRGLSKVSHKLEPSLYRYKVESQ